MGTDRLRLVVSTDSGRADVVVHLCDGTVTVAELAAALGLGTAGDGLSIDGRPSPAGVPIVSTPIADGSIVAAAGPPPTTDRPGCDVLQVSGLDAGRWWRLAPGHARVGAAGEVLHLEIGRDGVRILPYGAHDLALETTPVHAPVDAGGGWITAGGRRYRVERSASPSDRRSEAGPGGTTVFRRPPRHRIDPGPAAIAVPEAPAEPREAQPLSWIAVVAPVPVGILMAFLIDPRFLVFTMMSPLMMVGRWAEGRYRRRQEVRRHTADSARWRSELESALADAVRRETLRRRRLSPDLAQLARAAETGHHTLWERRLVDDDALTLVVGTARPVHRPEVDGRPPGGDLDPLLVAGTVLDAVPVTVDLLGTACVGIAGDRAAALAVARSLVVQATVLHGPADVAVAVLTCADRAHDWTWAKWLPHRAGGESGGLALEPTAAAALLPVEAPTGRHGPGLFDRSGRERRPVTLLIVDDDGRHLSGRVGAVREALADADGGVRAIVVADDITGLPAVCSTALDVRDDGGVTVHRLDGTGAEAADAVGTSGDVADRVARSLARWCDPDAGGASASMPDTVPLISLLDAGAGDVAESVIARWRDADRRTLRSPLGATASGIVDVDLVGDGPHALVAGTTGAGKSELLRSWVVGLAASADVEHVNFVLVDFKGGGAFDLCADLPHTVAVITDLDEHLAARALRCLHAEVRHREVRLRGAGVSDIADLPDGDPSGPLPRLVVVIDEFATLAAELPEFLDSLVDVAQRGRSLGVHMVLATQRPQGVLDNKIRANTNLRIALRVQDESDSMDVIDTIDASAVPRRRPGRGWVRLGAGELVPFQSALVTATTPEPGSGPRVTVEPFDLLDLPEAPGTATTPDGAGDATDLVRLVAGYSAAGNSGCTMVSGCP